jgi:hypothetical protein
MLLYYASLLTGIKEALWLRSLLKLMGFEKKTATSILCDNMGAIILTKDPTFHARTKHIDVARHFIHESHMVKLALHTCLQERTSSQKP